MQSDVPVGASKNVQPWRNDAMCEHGEALVGLLSERPLRTCQPLSDSEKRKTRRTAEDYEELRALLAGPSDSWMDGLTQMIARRRAG